MSVATIQRNIPEERRSHWHRGGSLESSSVALGPVLGLWFGCCWGFETTFWEGGFLSHAQPSNWRVRVFCLSHTSLKRPVWVTLPAASLPPPCLSNFSGFSNAGKAVYFHGLAWHTKPLFYFFLFFIFFIFFAQVALALILLSVLRQVHSLFQTDFSTECDLGLPLSILGVLSLP